jgi:hypothetical protein
VSFSGRQALSKTLKADTTTESGPLYDVFSLAREKENTTQVSRDHHGHRSSMNEGITVGGVGKGLRGMK